MAVNDPARNRRYNTFRFPGFRSLGLDDTANPGSEPPAPAPATRNPLRNVVATNRPDTDSGPGPGGPESVGPGPEDGFSRSPGRNDFLDVVALTAPAPIGPIVGLMHGAVGAKAEEQNRDMMEQITGVPQSPMDKAQGLISGFTGFSVGDRAGGIGGYGTPGKGGLEGAIDHADPGVAGPARGLGRDMAGNFNRTGNIAPPGSHAEAVGFSNTDAQTNDEVGAPPESPSPEGPGPGDPGTGGTQGLGVGNEAPDAPSGFSAVDAQTADEEGAPGGPGGGGGSSDEGGGSAADGNDAWYEGGLVTADRLSGPNPPGPDDGTGKLDIGEFVLRDQAVEDLGPENLELLNESPEARQAVASVLAQFTANRPAQIGYGGGPGPGQANPTALASFQARG